MRFKFDIEDLAKLKYWTTFVSIDRRSDVNKTKELLENHVEDKMEIIYHYEKEVTNYYIRKHLRTCPICIKRLEKLKQIKENEQFSEVKYRINNHNHEDLKKLLFNFATGYYKEDSESFEIIKKHKNNCQTCLNILNIVYNEIYDNKVKKINKLLKKDQINVQKISNNCTKIHKSRSINQRTIKKRKKI